MGPEGEGSCRALGTDCGGPGAAPEKVQGLHVGCGEVLV